MAPFVGLRWQKWAHDESEPMKETPLEVCLSGGPSTSVPESPWEDAIKGMLSHIGVSGARSSRERLNYRLAVGSRHNQLL